ncbi:MAG: sigma-E processing peptidase SpoIIGA [Clostridia bacterium]|nr:sigma-E processing peptidase SpoIIGA [Clostridia bacterium]
MEQVVYGDVYLAINFTMDWLALYLTAKAVKQPVRPLRISLAAALGAIYALASLFLPDGNALSTFTALAFPFLLILVAFSRQGGRRELFRTLAAFWAISFLLGGAATAVSYLVARWAEKEAVIGGQVETLPADLPFWGLILLALTVGAVVSLLLRGRKKLPSTVTVEVGEDANSLVALDGLVDSGNLLTEPLSGHSVILVDRSAATFLPAELAFLRDGSTPALTPRLRLIPYSTAAGEVILYGYLPRIVQINGKPRAACVAVAPLPEGERRADAIVPTSLY